jgi:transposase
MADAETWSKRVEEWRASGLTAKEFSARHGLTVSGLRNWSYRLRVAEKVTAPVSLVPVTVKPPADPAAASMAEAERPRPALTLELGEVRISVPTGFDRVARKVVLEILGERPSRAAR